MKKTAAEIKKLLTDKLFTYFSVSPQKAAKEHIYKAIALILMDELAKRKKENDKKIVETGAKRVYYLCMEFLLGKSMKNNLYNMEMADTVAKATEELGFDLNEILEYEADAGLGNGGLGRLAACFLDSLATMNYPAMGFSIRYEYGLFKQKIVDDQQVELPDIWLNTGELWMTPRADRTFRIKFNGYIREEWSETGLKIHHENADIVEARPYDLIIPGKSEGGVAVLRLWRASANHIFDMKSFTQGDYLKAMSADNDAEIISKVLYPSDDHEQGKLLRLKQQYFLVSASLQNIIRTHLKHNDSMHNFHEKAAIHINDTHPALAIPELMRMLIDEYNFPWEEAWHITSSAMAYTNHTVMSEALEKWSDAMIQTTLPRIYTIIKEIDRRFREEAFQKTNGDYNKINNMSVIAHGQIKMANLSVIGSHSVNGVSKLHSDILKDSLFADFNKYYPHKLTNVTNGIAYRRWLCQSNPALSKLIESLIGDKFILDASQLSGLLKFKKDKTVLSELEKIKQANKINFADTVNKYTGKHINPYSRFDTQIKRLHEYKRQLMNALKIIHYYIDLLKNPNKDVTPQTFIFGAKAAGGYYHAKRVISLLNCLSSEIDKNPKIREKLNVYFMENYSVTKAENLIPASEVSEQISLAGKEASGTSNMKFMINGALTLGTVDGANVEILENVGEDNMFVFGLKADEVENKWKSGYYSSNIYTSNPQVKEIIDRLKIGFNGQSFSDLADYLVIGSMHVADPYMCLEDYEDYLRAASDMDAVYKNKQKWNEMSLINIAKAGVFSSDRSIDDYAKNIWNLKKI